MLPMMMMMTEIYFVTSMIQMNFVDVLLELYVNQVNLLVMVQLKNINK